MSRFQPRALSHVLLELAQKIIKGQDPLHILGDGQQIRHYTYGGDWARLMWTKINGAKPFRYVSDQPFAHDVQKRLPDVSKAKGVLGFAATTTLSQMLDEVIPWIREQVRLGTI